MCSEPLMSHAVMVRGPSLQLDSQAKLVGCRASSRHGKSLVYQSAPLARVGMPRDVTRSQRYSDYRSRGISRSMAVLEEAN